MLISIANDDRAHVTLGIPVRIDECRCEQALDDGSSVLLGRQWEVSLSWISIDGEEFKQVG